MGRLGLEPLERTSKGEGSGERKEEGLVVTREDGGQGIRGRIDVGAEGFVGLGRRVEGKACHSLPVGRGV